VINNQPSRFWIVNPYLPSPEITLQQTPEPGFPETGYSDPIAWAVPFLISIVTSLEAASAMKDTAAAEQAIAVGERAISQFLDDYCGTPPRLIPWPFPGPPPWISVIASQLATAAHTFEGGTLRAALIELSGRVLRLALNPQPLPPSP
jgi:hypothetical protein